GIISSYFKPHQILLLGSSQQRQRFHDISEAQFPVLLKPLRFERVKDAVDILLSEQAAKKKIALYQPVKATSQRRRLLVVEDNVVNQQVARGRLEKMGYDVRVAENGAVALELLQLESFDLI